MLAGRPVVSRYDLVPYAGQPVVEAQCRRLETMAVMFHLSPAPPARAKILELGCGTADNLAWQALEYPEARFIGCDSSFNAVSAGRELIRELGLKNVDLRLQDIRDVDPSWGTFDYIFCRGVFSWVGPNVRQRILEIFRNHLAPQGVGYLSYNSFPGWAVREVVRNLMRLHTLGIDDPQKAISEAREILAIAAESHSIGGSFGPLLGRENIILKTRYDDSYVYHELLAEHNQPFYFEEFQKQIEAAGLQYVGDVEFAAMHTWDLPEKARASLAEMSFLAREQYLDYLRGTMFRNSVLCLNEAPVDRRLEPTMLERFAVGLAS